MLSKKNLENFFSFIVYFVCIIVFCFVGLYILFKVDIDYVLFIGLLLLFTMMYYLLNDFIKNYFFWISSNIYIQFVYSMIVLREIKNFLLVRPKLVYVYMKYLLFVMYNNVKYYEVYLNEKYKNFIILFFTNLYLSKIFFKLNLLMKERNKLILWNKLLSLKKRTIKIYNFSSVYLNYIYKK